MDMKIILIATVAFVLICILGLVINVWRRPRFNSNIVATVTKIEVEATSLSSGWVVTAQWIDQRTGQTLLFRSPRLQFPPHLPVGGAVKVDIDPGNPRHYHMDL